jgi:hypothetical protein
LPEVDDEPAEVDLEAPLLGVPVPVPEFVAVVDEPEAVVLSSSVSVLPPPAAWALALKAAAV